MADINHTITLGIGTPGAIKEFLTFGLQIGTATEGTILTGDVAIRQTATGNAAIRQTATGNAAIRQTGTGDVDL
jgi:hypothetical protein